MAIKWLPRRYQWKALFFMLKNNFGALFLDPGLGKTSTTLAAIKILLGCGKSKGVLLIAPLRVCRLVWPNEIAKWENFNHLSHTFLHGDNKPSLWEKRDVYLINPAGLPWLYDELLAGLQFGKPCPFDMLVVDESTNFKNPTAKTRFLLLRDMLPLFKRRYLLTGTPAPKGLMDLWSQIYLADGGSSLGENFYKFRNKYFYTEDYNQYNWMLKNGSEDNIQKAVSEVVIEMSSEDNLNMPELMFNYIDVEISPKAFKIYKKVEKEFFAEIDGSSVTAEAVAQASIKCHQISNGRVYEDIDTEGMEEHEIRKAMRDRKVIKVHDAKIKALGELLGELQGKPVLIAYNFKHDLDALKEYLGEDTPHIGSGVSESKTEDYVRRWNKGEIPVLLGHPASMGHGLNLQSSANDICWYSLTWNLEEYMQFNARIYRQGVKGAVRVHHLASNGTIDKAMILRLDSRAKQQRDLREAIKQYRAKI